MFESGEMYLETIYVLLQKSPKVQSIDVAAELGYSKPSVSRGLTPRGNGTGTTDGSLSFTAAMRVVVRVHSGTPYCRTYTQMALAARLTIVDELVFVVAYFADCGSAVQRYVSLLTGRKTQKSEFSFLGHQLRAVSCRRTKVSHDAVLASTATKILLKLLRGKV